MAKRLLRSWTKSVRMDSLSAEAERFFTRLIMVADDFGRYDGHPRLLNAALFPLKKISDVKVAEWLDECVTVGVVAKYSVGGKAYIVIDDFGQRLQQKRSLFPEPPVDIFKSPYVTVDHGEKPPELEERTRRKKKEVEHEPADAEVTEPEVLVWPTFDDFWNLYDKKTDRHKCEKIWKKIEHPAREEIMIHVADYVKSTPDVKYRKNPQTYLNGKCWNDQIISPDRGTKQFTPSDSTSRIDELIASRNYSS